MKLLLGMLMISCSVSAWTVQDDLEVTTSPYSQKYLGEIKSAATVLAQYCPAVKARYVEKIEAFYYSDTAIEYKSLNPNASWGEREDDLSKPVLVKGLLGYKSKQYGWDYNVEFRIKDNASGHTHYIDVGGINTRFTGFMVQGKQVSLDFCNINATMQDHYYIALSETS